DSMWHSLCKELGLEELSDHADYIDNTARLAHRDALRYLMNERLRTATKAEWIQRFIAAGIPAGPIWTLDETFKDVHVLNSGCVETFDHPILGALKQIMNPIRLDRQATAGKRLPPPLLGEHTEAVLREFDVSESDSAMLMDRGIVQQFPRSH